MASTAEKSTNPGPGAGAGAGAETGRATAPERTRSHNMREPWWKIHLFRGMVNDIRKRAPYYLSDWTDAWNYRVVPATVYMFFAKSVLLHPSPPCDDFGHDVDEHWLI